MSHFAILVDRTGPTESIAAVAGLVAHLWRGYDTRAHPFRIQFDRTQVLPIRMSTQFRYHRGAQMTQHRSRFLDKKSRVCAIAARHRPSARPTRRRLATGIVPSSTHLTCGRIPCTHTRFRTSRPPSRARIRAGGFVCGSFGAWRVYRYTNSDCFHRQIK